MRRRSSQTRKTVRFAAHRILTAVRAPLDRDKRTRQCGQRPRARWCEREALWGPDGGRLGGGGGGGAAECGRMGLEEGACAAHTCVKMLEEGVVDHP